MSDRTLGADNHLLIEASKLTIKASQLIVEAEDYRHAAGRFRDQIEIPNKQAPDTTYDQARELRRQARVLLNQARDLLIQARSTKSQ
jgi:hypothetical protein